MQKNINNTIKEITFYLNNSYTFNINEKESIYRHAIKNKEKSENILIILKKDYNKHKKELNNY
jgi:hypothetical protein